MSYELNPGSGQNVAGQLTTAEQAILATELGLDVYQAGAQENNGASAASAMSFPHPPHLPGCISDSASAASA